MAVSLWLPGKRAIFLFKCFCVVYFWGSLLGLTDWPTWEKMLIISFSCLVIVVHSPGSFLGLTDWLPSLKVLVLGTLCHLPTFLQTAWCTLEMQSGLMEYLDSNISTGSWSYLHRADPLSTWHSSLGQPGLLLKVNHSVGNHSGTRRAVLLSGSRVPLLAPLLFLGCTLPFPLHLLVLALPLYNIIKTGQGVMWGNPCIY